MVTQQQALCLRFRERGCRQQEEAGGGGRKEEVKEERWVAGPRWPRAAPGTCPHRVRELLLAWALWELLTSAGILEAKGGTTQISETDTRWSQAESGEVRPKDKQVSLLQQNCMCFLPPGNDLINHLP